MLNKVINIQTCQVALSSVAGAAVMYLGRSFKPYSWTSPWQGALFAATFSVISMVAKKALSYFPEMNSKVSSTLQYGTAFFTATALSIALVKFKLAYYSVSLLGACALSLTAYNVENAAIPKLGQLFQSISLVPVNL